MTNLRLVCCSINHSCMENWSIILMLEEKAFWLKSRFLSGMSLCGHFSFKLNKRPWESMEWQKHFRPNTEFNILLVNILFDKKTKQFIILYIVYYVLIHTLSPCSFWNFYSCYSLSKRMITHEWDVWMKIGLKISNNGSLMLNKAFIWIFSPQ